jgi:thioredoxin-like negative regulator of GroEL
MSVPTLLLFKDGEVVETKQGFQTKEMLLRWISKYL